MFHYDLTIDFRGTSQLLIHAGSACSISGIKKDSMSPLNRSTYLHHVKITSLKKRYEEKLKPLPFLKINTGLKNFHLPPCHCQVNLHETQYRKILTTNNRLFYLRFKSSHLFNLNFPLFLPIRETIVNDKGMLFY